MGNYVGQAFAIEIANAYYTHFFFPILKALFQKLHGWSNAFQVLCKKLYVVVMLFFGIGVFEDETSFEQVNLLLIFQKNHGNFIHFLAYCW